MYEIVYEKKAIKDIPKLKAIGMDKKAKNLIDIVSENPFQNPPPYEKLLGNLKGSISRRINIQHRLVYEVDSTSFIKDSIFYEGTVKIIAMWSHYENV